jgi:hypothetical protein
MAKFQIDWTEEVWYRAVVDADSLEQAREKFWAGEYNDDAHSYGMEVQDSVEIEEVDDEN